MQRNRKIGFTVAVAIAVMIFVSACGKAKEELAELSNASKIEGHWLVKESEHAGAIRAAAENESVVLTFKDGKAAFSPTDSAQGQLAFRALSECLRGPRPYRVEGNSLFFEAVAACPEKSVAIQTLTDGVLKFPDPEEPNLTRVFTKIDQDKYFQLVKASDRR